MKLTVKDIKGNSLGEHEVKFEVITNGIGTQAVHDAVVGYMANQRSGTACTKTMGEVAGSGKKPWRQKGTGRARAGSFASPLWPGGGVTFGPKPRDYSKKQPKPAKKLALRKAVSERLNAGDVLIVDDLKLASSKTKDFLAVLSTLQVQGSTLVVTLDPDSNLRLASRNLQRVDVARSDDLNTYQVLRYDKVVITRNAFEKLEQRLS
jgi:large subunit ribosomal protein L4